MLISVQTLKKVEAMYKAGQLSSISQDELIPLIEALFEASPKSHATITLIRNSSAQHSAPTGSKSSLQTSSSSQPRQVETFASQPSKEPSDSDLVDDFDDDFDLEYSDFEFD